jgi:hypothetical protein
MKLKLTFTDGRELEFETPSGKLEYIRVEPFSTSMGDHQNMAISLGELVSVEISGHAAPPPKYQSPKIEDLTMSVAELRYGKKDAHWAPKEDQEKMVTFRTQKVGKK